MQAGRILLLIMALVALIGAVTTTYAAGFTNRTNSLVVPNVNKCSSSLTSWAFCPNDDVNFCLKPIPELPKEIQSAVITIPPQNPNSTSTPALSPSASPTVSPTSMPQLESQMASGSATLDSDKIFNLINEYRKFRGLAPFEKDDKVCSLAATRSIEIPAEIRNGRLHAGLYNRALPYWIFENAKYGSNEDGTVAWWLASPIHHESIVGDYKYSCVKCTGSYCSELFTSFESK